MEDVMEFEKEIQKDILEFYNKLHNEISELGLID